MAAESPPYIPPGAADAPLRREMWRLQARLMELGLARDMVVPAEIRVNPKDGSKSKKPLVCHAQVPYGVKELREFISKGKLGKVCYMGIIMHDLLVIDVDDHETVAWIEETFPSVVAAAPAETSTKGRHYFFVRCPRFDALKITDGARTLKNEQGEKLKIDIKTVTTSAKNKNGKMTRGLILTAPGPEREWLAGRSIYERAPPVMPDDFFDYIKTQWLRCKAPAATGAKRGAKAPARPGKRARGPKTPDAQASIAWGGGESSVFSNQSSNFPEEDVVYDLCGGRARLRADGTIELRTDPERDGEAACAWMREWAAARDPGDPKDKRTDADAAAAYTYTGEWTKNGRVGASFRFPGLCRVCEKERHESNSFTVFWNGAGSMFVRSKSGKCKPDAYDGSRSTSAEVQLPKGAVQAYNRELERVLDALPGARRGSAATFMRLLDEHEKLNAHAMAAGEDAPAWLVGDTAYARIDYKGEAGYFIVRAPKVSLRDVMTAPRRTGKDVVFTRCAFAPDQPRDRRTVYLEPGEWAYVREQVFGA